VNKVTPAAMRLFMAAQRTRATLTRDLVPGVSSLRVPANRR
jgi:hypothetical protein